MPTPEKSPINISALSITSYLSAESKTKLQVEHLQVLEYRLQGKTNKEISGLTGYAVTTVSNFFNDPEHSPYLKPYLDEALHNQGNGLLDPIEIAKSYEQSVLRVFNAKVMDSETSNGDKLKFGTAILNYRQKLLSITGVVVRSSSDTQPVLPQNKLDRMNSEEVVDKPVVPKPIDNGFQPRLTTYQGA